VVDCVEELKRGIIENANKKMFLGVVSEVALSMHIHVLDHMNYSTENG